MLWRNLVQSLKISFLLSADLEYLQWLVGTEDQLGEKYFDGNQSKLGRSVNCFGCSIGIS